MTRLTGPLRSAAESVAAGLIAAMFATFILQVAVRYAARSPWIAGTFPWLDPANYGWTLEFCLACWVWLVFWGNSFVVRRTDHVTFDILYLAAPRPVRLGFIIAAGLIVAIGLLLSVVPTWERFHILRLKKTATLSTLFGDGIRMRDIYVIYIVFLVAVPARALLQVWRAFRHGTDDAGAPAEAPR